ncbi:MAG: sodium:proton antiporter, partial [Bdellovibrionales bacterium]|nr:sodium:proton antiporter [Bdellovibrionales bacterium]
MHGPESIQNPMAAIAIIFALGISAQWLAWKFRVPSIILLLVFGFLGGPVTGLVKPDALLGDLLSPLVSLSVALILFEGGLSLRLAEVPGVQGVIFKLISVGMVVTWIVGAWAAHQFLDMSLSLSILLGAILTVSGPTVIIPLLRDIRPKATLGSILKWEGILIDPVGALCAVLVFEVIKEGDFLSAPIHIAYGVIMTAIVGGVVGFLGATLLIFLIRNYLMPDYLQNPLSLSLVFIVHTVADSVQPESGLFAVTLMGILLANRSSITVKHIVEFKENLQVLLIGVLFILLSARLKLEYLDSLQFQSVIFLGVMVFVARPLAVIASTIGSGLSWRERLFLSWMAPRGIVAAAVSSLFSLELSHAGVADADQLVAFTFLVIVGAGFLYGLTSAPVARFLKVQQQDPQGVLFLGAHVIAREIAQRLKEEGFKVLLVDTNWGNVSASKLAGLPAHYGNILSENIVHDLDLNGIGRLFAMTPNDEANSLAALRFTEHFGRANVYQLPHDNSHPGDPEKLHPQHLRGRFLFGPDEHYFLLVEQMTAGARIKTINITDEFSFEDVKAHYTALF